LAPYFSSFKKTFTSPTTLQQPPENNMDAIKSFATKVECRLNAMAVPLKPHLPLIARFLLVTTFLEDTLRILSQWSDQVYYLENYQGMAAFIAHAFLYVNCLFMAVGSFGVVAKKFPTVAISLLSAVVILQSIGYGLLFDPTFMFRNLSVLGGLLMLLSDAMSVKRRHLFAGLPTMGEVEKTAYVQLAGRILLVALFLSLALGGEMTLFRGIMCVIGLGVSVMVVIGFKAKYSALMLVLLLSVGNIVLNNFWTLHASHPHRYVFLF
jgi:hypothetical protein